MAAVNEAWSTLKDKKLREEYDLTLDDNGFAGGAPGRGRGGF